MSLGYAACAMRELGLIRTSAQESFARAEFVIAGVWIAVIVEPEGGRSPCCDVGSRKAWAFFVELANLGVLIL